MEEEERVGAEGKPRARRTCQRAASSGRCSGRTVWLSGLERRLRTERSQVRILLRARSQGVGEILGQGMYWRQPIHVSLSHRCCLLSLSLSLSQVSECIVGQA